MSQPRTLTVNQNEILARADEVESPIADPPSNAVVGACALDAATTAARQLMLSADNLRAHFAAGAKERHRLAEFMRNIAKAYNDVDEDSATALNNGGQGALSPAVLTGNAARAATLSDTQTAPAAKAPVFIELKEARMMLDQPDQAASLKAFAEAWNKYNLTLQESLERFREFEDWDGDAAAAIQAAFVQHRDWLRLMAQLSATLAKQALDLSQTHRWATDSHPTLEDIVNLQLEYAKATANHRSTQQCMKKYAAYQRQSEEVLSGYSSKAMPEPVNPPKPPPAPTKNDPQPQGGSGDVPWGGTPMTPPMPMTPFTGAPGGDGTQAAANAAHRAGKLAPNVGIKPASVGGGGGLGGGALAPPSAPGIDGKSMPAVATGDPAGLGRGSVARGGPMGGGMPMGGHGQGQGKPDTKKTRQAEEALYTENRAWTEGLIGTGRAYNNEEK